MKYFNFTKAKYFFDIFFIILSLFLWLLLESFDSFYGFPFAYEIVKMFILPFKMAEDEF